MNYFCQIFYLNAPIGQQNLIEASNHFTIAGLFVSVIVVRRCVLDSPGILISTWCLHLGGLDRPRKQIG
jgi:hypothetical protein